MLSFTWLRKQCRLSRWVSLMFALMVLGMSCVVTACVEQHYRTGECFVMRGTGSQGRVLQVQDQFYVIELVSSNAEWTVRQSQLNADIRPCDCPPGLFTTLVP